jgi:tagaturonate reductase
MQLSKKTVVQSGLSSLSVPDPAIFELPERILQFGSGVLLRGLIDYFIDKANKEGNFNGRIVVVHSIEKDRPVEHEKQDYLYTHCLRGIQNGQVYEEYIANAVISRVLLALSEWDKVLDCAADPGIEIVFSNTTEVGIVMHADDNLSAFPPASFPGKMLALLYKRYQAFNGDPAKGWTIVPAELIANNGSKLQSIIIELAHLNKMDYEFIDWIENACRFCNTLVDRIVPGKLPPSEQVLVEEKLGYTDGMMIMSEVYSLWAIETSDPSVKDILSFAKSNPGVIITDDINKYRELKLRLLNGTHTFVCGLAYLAGFETVKDAMQNKVFNRFVYELMADEISPCITGDEITTEQALTFSRNVIERFENPFIEHKWLSITLNYTYKMKARNLFLLLEHYNRNTHVPEHMALSFAAYLLFNKCEPSAGKGYEGTSPAGEKYSLQDDEASLFHELWQHETPEQIAIKILGNPALWDTDLTALPGFADAVIFYLNQFVEHGVANTLNQFQELKTSRTINETQSIEG